MNNITEAAMATLTGAATTAANLTDTIDSPQARARGSKKSKLAALYSALVTKSDASWLKATARNHGHDVAAVAAVAATAGGFAVRDDEINLRMNGTLKTSLWSVINRDARLFTCTVPVGIQTCEVFLMKCDAKQFGREIDDWLGTLIHLGIEVLRHPGTLPLLTKGDEFALLLGKAAFELKGDGE
jgi:hypothetical protein